MRGRWAVHMQALAAFVAGHLSGEDGETRHDRPRRRSVDQRSRRGSTFRGLGCRVSSAADLAPAGGWDVAEVAEGLQQIVATVLGEGVDPSQPLMEVRDASLSQILPRAGANT